ncbi:MAG: NUMOD3 domain-containing DNA-binding protein [Phycisphaerales bacterium]|nr:NUMOD3 domain-containing DNA-binding protein [Phycisphaerales bacterium]
MAIISGVYIIRNRVNGNGYVGSSVNTVRRWQQHRRELFRNNHDNGHLQAAWNKYGAASFEIEILEECAPTDCVSVEQRYLDKLKPAYNICKVANSVLGVKRSAATRAKIRAATIGKSYLRGYKHSPETCAKNSARQMGNRNAVGHVPSAASLAIRSAKLKGLALKPEHRAKIVAALIGRPVTAETRAKISEANAGRGAGRKLSEETRARMSASRTGRLVSVETRAKISAALKARAR